MKKITTRKELLERIKDIRAVEILARDGYEQDTYVFKNFLIVNTIKKIKKDEDKHILLLDKLIDLLES